MTLRIAPRWTASPVMSMARPIVVVCLLAALLWIAPGVAEGQRLFARLDDSFVELGSGTGNLGRVIGHGAFPACEPARGYDPRTWPVLYGRYLAWERDGGICLLNTVSGDVRSIDLPEPEIVAASMDTFGLVLATHDTSFGRIFLLASPSGPLTSSDLEGDIFIVPATRQVVAIAGASTVPELPLAVRITIASLDTGAVERRMSVTPPSPMGRFAVSRQGTLIAALRAWRASPWEDWVGDAVYVLDLETGSVRSATGLRTMRLDSRHLLEFSDDGAELRIATPAGIVRLDAATLEARGHLDVPRVRLPLTPGWETQHVSWVTFEDSASHRLFLVEEEWQHYSYTRHDLRRITLSAVDLARNRTTASFELLEAYGLDTYFARYFFVPPPPAPRDLICTVASTSPPSGGAAVTITWSTVPGATHYVVEAGSAPGLADRLTLNVWGPAVTFNGVPPGRYYVRVRAVGIGGQGPRSDDLPVTVP